LKKFGFIIIILFLSFLSGAQTGNCIFKDPQYTIHFGTGNVGDINSSGLPDYMRVRSSCPQDGFYSFVSYTSNCFNDDWHTIIEDHTAADVDGNMLLVNAVEGMFLKTTVPRLKSNTTYELGLWLMNLCRPTNKCPFPLLPRLNIRLETLEGNIVANIVTGELPRFEDPRWIQHRALFTTPALTSDLTLVMIDNSPAGCGNDFALDDITFRECVRETPKSITPPKTTTSIKPSTIKPPVKKTIIPEKKIIEPVAVVKPKTDSVSKSISVIAQSSTIFPAPPLILKTRENELVKKFETEAGDIKIELYDNGEVDGDTVSIYHNNELIRSHMRLSQKPISITLTVDPSQPHHEMVMVAENLGSIPPNTSIMIITTASKRYQVFISSTEQKNAKVVFDLKK